MNDVCKSSSLCSHSKEYGFLCKVVSLSQSCYQIFLISMVKRVNITIFLTWTIISNNQSLKSSGCSVDHPLLQKFLVNVEKAFILTHNSPSIDTCGGLHQFLCYRCKHQQFFSSLVSSKFVRCLHFDSLFFCLSTCFPVNFLHLSNGVSTSMQMSAPHVY